MSVRSKFVASNFKFICLFFMTVEWKGIQYVFEGCGIYDKGLMGIKKSADVYRACPLGTFLQIAFL